MVVGSGLSSNFSDTLLEVIQASSEMFEAPPVIEGKSLSWEPLPMAA